MSFKENLKDELEYKGMSSKELAILSGLPQGSISNYLKENSSIPSADVAVKIAKVLNVSVEYLVTGKDSHISIKHYSPDIKSISDKLENLSDRDKKIVSSLVSLLSENK